MSASPRLQRRTSRPVAATLTAIILLGVALGLATAAIARLIQGQWYSPLARTASQVSTWAWQAWPTLLTGAIITLLGLILLGAGILPGRLRHAVLTPAGPGGVADTEFVVTNRGLARVAAARAHAVDGVDKVRTRANGRAVHLTVTTSSDQGSALRSRVQDHVTQGLQSAGLTPLPKVSTTVRTKEL